MLKIRPFYPGDFEEVKNLHSEAATEEPDELEERIPEDDWLHPEDIFIRNKGELVVGICENRIVATGALKRVDDVAAEIRWLFVSPEYRARSFADAIYDFLEDKAKQLGYQKLGAETSELRIAIRNLFQKKGYAEVGRMEIDGVHRIYLQKIIAPLVEL